MVCFVGPDEFEPKHPQLGPFRTVSDPQALVDSRPEQDLSGQRSMQYGLILLVSKLSKVLLKKMI